MNIIVHLPTTLNGSKELSKRMAQIYADSTLQRLRSSGYSPEEQKQILSNVITKVKKQAESV